MSLSEIIRNFRKENNLTKYKLASLAGIAPSTVGLIEANITLYPTADTLYKLSRVLGVPVGYLLGQEDLSENPLENAILNEFKKLNDVDKEIVGAIIDLFLAK